jgi:hypothetical protein
MRSAFALVACRVSLKVPSDDFFQVIHVLPRNRFQHSPFVPLNDVLRRSHPARSRVHRGGPKETRLALLKDLNGQIGSGIGRIQQRT